MRKALLILIFLTCVLTNSFASHIIGGAMRYEYVGPGTTPNSKIFRIVMIRFSGDATGPSVPQLAPSYIIGVYNNDNGQKFKGTAGSTGDDWIINQDPVGTPAVPIVFPSCIQDAPVLNYTYAVYTRLIELPDTQNGYTV